MTLSREAILSASDLPTETVSVPEWGGSVLVRTLDAAQRDEFEKSIVEQRGKNVEVNLQNLRAKLVALSVVDESGLPVFSTTDVPALAKKSAKAVDRIYTVAARLSGISKEDAEELAKNSESGPPAASPFA